MTTETEKNSFAKRARRYAGVTSAVAKMGRQAAAARFSSSQDTTAQAALLRGLLGNLKGPLMKIAQLVATIPDFLPAEYADELMTLQSEAPSMGWPFVRRRMAAELGPDWQKQFHQFDQAACAAASLGQVHKAVTQDGLHVACKLQYSDMASVVEADLVQLKLLFSLFDRFDGSLRTQDKPFLEIEERLREELDYVREARNMSLYHDMLSTCEGVHVPSPISALSTTRLLTMTWLDGEKMVEAAASRNLDSRNAIAINMFRLWYTPFYHHGVIHGDPHLGNYTVREDNSINLLDFGCIRVFRPQLIQAVIMLFHALRDNNEEMAFEAYRLWGFENMTKEVLAVLTLWARFIYAPVLNDSARPIQETNNTLYGRETAMKVHKELKRLGGVSVPPEFVLIDRASIGLGSVFLRLNAEINWFRLFNELTEDFDVDTLALRQKVMLEKHGLSACLEGA